MKKILLITTLVLLAFKGFSQITLEHSYNIGAPVTIFKFSNGEIGYYSFLPATKELKIYNKTHALIKTINVPPTSGFEIYTISVVSDKTFNSDAAIEYGVSYYSPTTGAINKFVVLNETGTQLLNVGNGAYIASFFNTTTGTKMMIHRSPQNGSDIYSVPGQYMALRTTDELEYNEASAFPNPSGEKITINHGLKPGQAGVLKIHDNAGREINSFQIDGTFSNLLLNTNDLQNGTYLYQIESNGKIETRSRFTVLK